MRSSIVKSLILWLVFLAFISGLSFILKGVPGSPSIAEASVRSGHQWTGKLAIGSLLIPDFSSNVRSKSGLDSILNLNRGLQGNFANEPLVTISISGRVTSSTGSALRGVVVSAVSPAGAFEATTSSFGFYEFANLPSPETYTIVPVSKRYRFIERTVAATTNMSNIDFLGYGPPYADAGPDQNVTFPNTIQLGGAVFSGIPPLTALWSKVSGPGSVSFANSSSAATTANVSTPGTYVLRLSVSDEGARGESDDVQITTNTVEPPPPPDPVTVAPPIRPTVATNPFESTKFLYSGPNPIQTGVAADTIKAKRVGLIRGRVLNRANQPLQNVNISILDRPELGQTRSRADGMFDLVINAGGDLTVKYEKQGYIPLQREEKIDWQRFDTFDDVVMIGYDPNVAIIDLASQTPIQVASGTTSTDASGTRRSRLFFKQGTQVTFHLPDGSTQQPTSINVRSTEFTVGPNGREAMPGDLPPTSEYTYAAEYSVDEAVALNATDVTFDRPVIQYLENFIGFPVGSAVPTGSYNRKTAEWEPEPSGKVIRILSITSGTANLDVTGSGNPATDAEYTALGINTAERQKLAELYLIDQQLWRVPLNHFSSWDCNYPPSDRPPPDVPAPFVGRKPKKICDEKDGCIPEIQSQSVTEEIEIHRTGYQISYGSVTQVDYVEGIAAIPLVGPTPPPWDLENVGAFITVAGKTTQTALFTPSANLTYNFVWDGTDYAGRRVQGPQTASVKIVHLYPVGYVLAGEFGATGTGSGPTFVRTGAGITTRDFEIELGSFDQGRLGLGGWAFENHHVYDPISKTLYEGNGARRSASSTSSVVNTTSGTGDVGNSGDGGPAISALLSSPTDLAFAADGTYYVVDHYNNRIRRVSPNGVINGFAGDGTDFCEANLPCGDGGPAVNAKIASPTSVAVAHDGSVFVSDTNRNRIRKVGLDGVITTVAGTGAECDPMAACGDGGPAASAQLNQPRYIHIAQDGSLYIADSGSNRVRKVGTNGNISTVAGSGNVNCPNDNVPTRQACIDAPTAVALTANGELYITAGDGRQQSRIFRLGTDGLLKVVMTRDNCNGARPSSQEGDGPGVCNPKGLTIGPDGKPYFAAENMIHRIDPDGTLRPFIGTGEPNFNGEGQPVLRSNFGSPASAVFAPDGTIYVAAAGENRIRRVTPALPGFTGGDILIPSEDGSEAFQFDSEGRHLRTLNGLTGTNKYVFGYNSAGQLTSITDGDNDVTTIERASDGKPTGIRNPYGQITSLTTDGNGYLSSVTSPGGETYQYTYSSGGLLLTKRDPLGHQNTFTYNADGRLIRNDNAGAGSTTFTRTGNAVDFTVAHRDPLNRISSYRVINDANGDETVINTYPDGSRSRLSTTADGSTFGTDILGTVGETNLGPDPRWRMQSPLISSSRIETPGGVTFRAAYNRTVSLPDVTNPFSLTQQTESLAINGNIYSSVFTAAGRTIVTKSPLNRQLSLTIDAQERVIGRKFANLNAFSYLFDGRGRIQSFTAGPGAESRTTAFDYDSSGGLASITDPLSRVHAFTYDAAGRVTRQTLPDDRFVAYVRDAEGKITSLTPAGRPAHLFGFDVRDRISSYTAPSVGGNSQTTFTYALDDQLTRVTRPDGLQLNFNFDSAGKRSSLTIPSGTYTYGYNPTTGSLTSVSAPGGVLLNFVQDGPLLLQTTWGGPITGTISNTFDSFFRPLTQSINGSQTISFDYDSDGLMIAAGNLSINRNTENGLIMSASIGSITDTRVYDGFAERTSYIAKFNTTDLFAETLVFNKLGRITQKTETSGGATNTYAYGYDTAGRLTSVFLNGGTQPITTYGYDLNNNRTNSTLGTTITTGSHDAQDRLTQYGDTTYAYTLNGELVSKTNGANTTQYSYDVIGNLRSVTLPNGTAIEYLIDGLNRRVAKKVGGVITQAFLYQDSLEPVAELNATNAVVTRFVYGTRANVPEYIVKGGVTYRIISDYLGSVRLVVDVNTGAIAQRLDYDEFGVVLQDTNPGFQPFGFAGGIYDTQTKLTRFGARDYDAETGRWTTKDPLLFASSVGNVYEYAGSDPVNFIDPNGLKSGGTSVSPGVDGVAGSKSGTATDGIRVIDKMKKSDGNRAGNLQKSLEYYQKRLKVIEKTLTIKRARMKELQRRMAEWCKRYPNVPYPPVIMNERMSLEIQIKDLETERTLLKSEELALSAEKAVDDHAVPLADKFDKGANYLDYTWWASQFGKAISGQGTDIGK